MDLRDFLNSCITRAGYEILKDTIRIQTAPNGDIVSLKGTIDIGNGKKDTMYWNPATGRCLNSNDIRFDLVLNQELSSYTPKEKTSLKKDAKK